MTYTSDSFINEILLKRELRKIFIFITDFETRNKSRNTGQIASRGSSFRDAVQRPPNTGRPVKYGTPGKPIPYAISG